MLACFSIITLFAGVCHAQMGSEKCHSVALIPGFDVKKVEGVWYAYELSNRMKAAQNCLTFTWTDKKEKPGSDNSIILKKSKKNLLGQYQVSDIPISQVATTSQMSVKESESATRQAWIIGTDYKNYLTGYICKPGQMNQGIYTVWTRKKHPTDEIVTKAHDTLTKSGFKSDPNSLFKSKQEGCTT